MRQGGVRGTWANEGAAPWSWTNLVNMTVESAHTTHTHTTAPGQYGWPGIFISSHPPTYTLMAGEQHFAENRTLKNKNGSLAGVNAGT